MNDNTSKKRVYWNRKMIALLIQLYKENECLYDKKHEDYNNRSEKGEALTGILNEMKKFLPQLQPEDISRKLKIVRSQFSYELGLIDSAEAVGVTYESKLWFFQQLSFLRKHMSRVPPKREDLSRAGLINSLPVWCMELSSITRGANIDNAISNHGPILSSSNKKNVSLNELSYDDDSDSNDGGKSLFEELAVDKNPSSQDSITGRRELRRRHIKIKWNNEITEKFINFLKNEPCLYDVEHEDFADRAKRAEARLRLVQDMQQFVPSICLHDVLVKMRCLRNQYSREWRQIAMAAENNKKYKPRLWCFHQLSYLKAPHTYDGRSEIGEYEDTTRQDVNNTSNNGDTDISDTNDGIDTTNEEELELPTENDDEDDREERDEEIGVDELENSAIHEIPNENIPNKPQHFCFAGTNKKIDSKSAFKAENDQDFDDPKVYTNYDWLGRLVVSQLDEISPSYRNEFAWDVQRLVRKYILKTKGEGVNDDGSSIAHGSKMSDQIKEFVLPRSSNVSLNISFT